MLVVLLSGVVACDKILDINENPNAETQDDFLADPGLLFVHILTEISSDRVLETNVFNRWAQYYVRGDQTDKYVVPEFPQARTFPRYYEVLRNTFLGENAAKDAQKPNMQAQYQIMKAFTFYSLTVIFENVPYHEVMDFDGENLFTRYPKYDSQETILKQVVNELDEAMALIDTSNPERIEQQDLLYAGDMEKWKKFANSLKIRTLVLLSEKLPEYHVQLDAAFNEPFIDEFEESAIFHYGDGIGNANQLYKFHEQFLDGNSRFVYASKPFVDLLDDKRDIRTNYFFDFGEDNKSGFKHYGIDPGTGAFTITSVLSLNFIYASMPDIFISAAEMKFLQAEAILKKWITGSTQDAQVAYEQGVRLNFEYLNSLDPIAQDGGINQIFIDSYLENRLSNLSVLGEDSPNALRAIYYQAYVDYYHRGVDAWTFVRRTNYPPTRPMPEQSALGDHITRLPYSTDEINTNVNVYADFDKKELDEPMWFMPEAQ